MTNNPNFVRLDEFLDDFESDVRFGEPPQRFAVGDGFDSIRLGPGNVTLLGGAPGAGKTALAMQWVIDSLIADEQLSVCIANVEMTPAVLMERQLSRLSGTSLSLIRDRSTDVQNGNELVDAFDALREIAHRIVFVTLPMTLHSVCEAADSIDADLLVLDYIQRLRLNDDQSDRRGVVDQTMEMIRRFADADRGVLALSAVTRGRNANGQSSYSGATMSLASFRESSELEYGADDAYILAPSGDGHDEHDSVIDVTLRHLKSRNGSQQDVQMEFDRSIQRFGVGSETRRVNSSLDLLSQLWESSCVQSVT